MTADADYAQQAIAQGSQSFAAAARLFDPSMRRDVTRLYAWCRHCDDVIDGQQLGMRLGMGTVVDTDTPSARLAQLRRRTQQMLAGETIAHPAWADLLGVIERHQIPPRLLFDHLDGFACDVDGRSYNTLPDLLTYCYGVAGVVGLMMAHIMGVRAPETLDRASDLGLAFQLTNIARDIGEDHRAGRVYLPHQWLDQAGLAPDDLGDPANGEKVAALAARLVEAAEPYYASASVGLADLPLRAAWAIGAARLIYRQIGHKVVQQGPAALTTRVRTGKGEKLFFLVRGLGAASASRFAARPARPAALWSRPTGAPVSSEAGKTHRPAPL